MFVVSLLQNGTCRCGWVTQTEPAFRSVPLAYSNNINCGDRKLVHLKESRLRICPLMPDLLGSRFVQAVFKSVKAEFGFLKYT